MPKDAQGRVRLALVLLGVVVIAGLLLWFAGAIIEPVRFGGLAI